MCHLPRATQGNPLNVTTEPPPPVMPAPPDVNGFSNVVISHSSHELDAEVLYVEVLKDGGRVTVKNMPYGRVHAAEDRSLINSESFKFLRDAGKLNPRILTALEAEAKRKGAAAIDERILFYQPAIKRGSTTPNPFFPVIGGWTQVWINGEIVAATAEDTIDAFTHAIKLMPCYSDMEVELKSPDGTKKVNHNPNHKPTVTPTFPHSLGIPCAAGGHA